MLSIFKTCTIIIILSLLSPIYASSPFGEPVINIGAYNQLSGFKVNSYSKGINNNPMSIEASIEWTHLEENPYYTLFNTGSDIYFGVFSPDMKKVWSWKREKGGDNGILLNGLVVYEEKSIVKQYHSNKGYSNAMYYSINDSIEAGMYLLFILLVAPDTDPNDRNNWQHIGTQPIFITN